MNLNQPARRYLLALAAILTTHPAIATTLRIAEYNIDCSDQGNNNAISGPNAGIPAVLQAMGLHEIGTNAQPLDVIAFTELLDTGNNTKVSTSLPLIVSALNNIYGAGTYAYVNTPDPTSGGTQFNGPSGLVYNTKTVQAPTAIALGYSGNTSTNIPRAPMRYQITPVGYGSNATFYMYVSHYKADPGTGNQTTRNQEATEIRANADALPANSHIIYTGDFNLTGGASEPSYATLTSPGNGRAYDPTAPSTFISTFTGNSTTYKYLYSEATDSLDARFDMQLVSNAVLTQPGLQLATDLSDPSDPNNFPSSKYPYALEIFGNNGSTDVGAATNLSTNTSLNDLNTVANPQAAITILNDLMQPSGSDHLPIVADYNLVGVAPPIVSWLTASGGSWQNQNNWQFSGIPDATSDTSFNLTGNYTVTASAATNVKNLNINSGNVTFSFAGQSLNVAGALTLGATSPASLTITNSNVAITGAITIHTGSMLTLNAGTRATALSNAGTLDLTSSKLTLEDTSMNRLSDIQTLRIQAASNAIVSSTAQSANTSAGRPVFAVAVVDNAIRIATFPTGSTNFGGTNNVDANSILITAAYLGDANLDGTVDIQDLQDVANHWQQNVTDWSQGDFNGDGIVDIRDLQALANNWQAGVSTGGGSGDTNFKDSPTLLSAFTGSAPTPELSSVIPLLSAIPLLFRRRMQRI